MRNHDIDSSGERRATNRREILLGGTVALAAIAGLSGTGEVAAQLPRVRRNWGKLDPSRPDDRRVMEQYADGVRILRARSAASASDRRGWLAQAELHRTRCQHGNWWFLPWHRAYLYYFERMIQDAVGDPQFALPYWDWTDPNQLAIPAAFRDRNSPLYDSSRRTGVNNGTLRLSWSTYAASGGVRNYVLNRPTFVPSLGSPEVGTFPGLERTHGRERGHGDFEGGVHDSVHIWVSGQGNPNMGSRNSAARDPLFWLHHCNVDRLWVRWLEHDPVNHRNPVSSTWRSQRFEFRRPDGNLELIAVNQLMSPETGPLNYRYED